MPFDGYGTFIRLRSWIVDATNSVKIRADFHDDEDNNFADGLSHCITKDGQTVIAQNIPFNSRRIISLADPIDPQDAATKDYADTKMPLDGSVPITGDVVIKKDTPTFTLNGKPGYNNGIYGQKNDKNRWSLILGDSTAETGNNAGSDFDLYNYADDGSALSKVLFGNRATGLMTVKADPTAALGIATKQYADAAATNAASSKLPITGGTITGALTVNGELIAVQNYIRFGSASSSGYLSWDGATTYTLGNAGTIWHSGNFNPATQVSTRISNIRLIWAGDNGVGAGGVSAPYAGGIITAASASFVFRWHFMQISTDGVNFFTITYTS